MFNIYVLKDPNTLEIRYVGKTTQPLRKRLSAHLSCAKRGRKDRRTTYVNRWIGSILQRGGVPLIEALEIGEDGDGSQQEIKWIQFGRNSNWRLANHTDGGDGGLLGRKRTPEELIQQSMRMKDPKCRHRVRQIVDNMTEEERQSIYAKISDSVTEHYIQHPESRILAAQLTRASWKDMDDESYKTRCKNISAGIKKAYDNSDARQRISVLTKAAMQRPEVKKKLSEGVKRAWAKRKALKAG
jgi:hypothetical protein